LSYLYRPNQETKKDAISLSFRKLKTIRFYKYHGTGNDFIMIDNRKANLSLDTSKITWLCNRRFGIGADGLILLETSVSADFRMIYFNADGKEGSMCGNGGRCIIAFANFLGLIDEMANFEAIDGRHQGKINKTPEGTVVALKMNDVDTFSRDNGAYIINTGSPHYVTFCNDIAKLDVVESGKKIRYGNSYAANGINVNYVSAEANAFAIRTYERGVEDETYSCGTGTVAAAIALDADGKTDEVPVKLKSLGGMLEVSFKKSGTRYTDIWLTGPAEMVFEGSIELRS
jgi:diaminopimelate epimerase